MSMADEAYRACQNAARAQAQATGKPVATDAVLTRHALESFLHRLTLTEHADSFVLKGGALLAAYDYRRTTRDVDSNAVAVDLTAGHVEQITRDLAQVEANDGVDFETDSIRVETIREGAGYPGLRMRIQAMIATWRGVVAWDISTGDPIVPAPRTITIDRVIGEPIRMLGYSVEMIIAEKGVTILERGSTSTRWRDYVDIVQLCSRGFDSNELRRSAAAVAQYRQVALGPVGPHLADYDDSGQRRWAAWRRKEDHEDDSDESLEAQLALVARYLDPVFERDRT